MPSLAQSQVPDWSIACSTNLSTTSQTHGQFFASGKVASLVMAEQ